MATEWQDTELHQISTFGGGASIGQQMGARPYGSTVWNGPTAYLAEWLDTELHSISNYGGGAAVGQEMGARPFGSTVWTESEV